MCCIINICLTLKSNKNYIYNLKNQNSHAKFFEKRDKIKKSRS